ncbi:hypothetical protein [Pyxidicoccus sp. MSG2]|uniref:hypothetical protein n=1 Tax=Pyxidicoccus sp. MSG2 TaxID=2996790 RepID=UPI00226F48B1|nr:hypothetical protein [Pyxidicoccus sp. MSG2]MCY1019252.1 hypothetical protein [Pyxidicoccus sp. MSG2]
MRPRTWRWGLACACALAWTACTSESTPAPAAPPPSLERVNILFGREEAPRAAELRFALALDVKTEVRERRGAPPRTASARWNVENVTRYRVLQEGTGGLELELTVLKDRDSDTPASAPSALEGHTFLAVSQGGTRTVTEQGRPVGPEQRERVLEMVDDSLGDLSDVGRVLAGTQMTPGERLPELEAVLSRMFQFGPDESERRSSVRARLRGGDPIGKIALVDVEMDVSLVEAPLEINSHLRGTLSLDLATGTPRRLDLRGPARVAPLHAAALQGMTAQGEGTLRLELEVSLRGG